MAGKETRWSPLKSNIAASGDALDAWMHCDRDELPSPTILFYSQRSAPERVYRGVGESYGSRWRTESERRPSPHFQPAIIERKSIALWHYFHQPFFVSRLTVAQDAANMDQIAHTSPALYPSLSPTATETTFHASPSAAIKNEDGSTAEHQKKKQKRNKPTLSCEECVERKTKVSGSFRSLQIELGFFKSPSSGEGQSR